VPTEGNSKFGFPEDKKGTTKFCGIMQFYTQNNQPVIGIMAPLTDLRSTKQKSKWIPEYTETFKAIQQAVSQNVMLSFPDYAKPFEVFCDASKYQVGSIIAQKTSKGLKPVAFFAAKMTPAQQQYMVTEQELLSVAMTLKKFRNMLLGYQLNIYTDHKNLTFSSFQADRTICWRLYVE
jgi:RNase H-like domain found in reverse transcriptase